jgi:uncharacterized membrane protein
MNRKGIRIPLIISGVLLFSFKGWLFGSYQWMIIPDFYNEFFINTQLIVLIISISLIIIGIAGFRGKSKKDEISELKDRVKELEKDEDE